MFLCVSPTECEHFISFVCFQCKAVLTSDFEVHFTIHRTVYRTHILKMLHTRAKPCFYKKRKRKMTQDTWHLTCDMWNMVVGVNIISKFQLPTSNGLWFMMPCRFGGKGWLTEWMNESVIRLFVKQPRLHRSVNSVAKSSFSSHCFRAPTPPNG